MPIARVLIKTDGLARGNPGVAAIGATIKDEGGQLIATVSQPIGTATNNQAEYRAIIAALEKAIGLGAKQVTLFSDSELVVNQVKGRYRIKNIQLRSLYLELTQLVGHLEGFTISHIPREENREADRLANDALK